MKEKQTAEEIKEFLKKEYIATKTNGWDKETIEHYIYEVEEDFKQFYEGYEYATLKLQEKDKEIERLKGEKGKFYVVAKSSEENWEQITQGLDTYDQAKHYKDSAFCKDKWKNSFIVQQIN